MSKGNQEIIDEIQIKRIKTKIELKSKFTGQIPTQMNHHTHSGNSSTAITNPNDFDSRTNKVTTTTLLSSHKLTKNGLSVAQRARETSNHDRTTNCKQQIDFDALESIPFDDIGPDKTDFTTIITSTRPNPVGNRNNDHHHDSNARPISAAFKKLTTYFSSSSSHKTLTNLQLMRKNRNKMKTKSKQIKSKVSKINNHNHYDKRLQMQSQMHGAAAMNNIDNCAAAIAIACHRQSVSSMESNENECCTDDEASTTTTTEHQTHNYLQKPPPPPPPPHHSSDRISSYISDCSSNKSLGANGMCRGDDDDDDDAKYAIDNRSGAVSPTRATKRQMELSTIEKSGESFSLPRVSLRQGSGSPTSTLRFNNQRNISNSSNNVTNAANKNMNCSNLDHCLQFGDLAEKKPSSSHYSTEKSGSSGYYSSNVYSTSSVEDHIYSEPIIDGGLNDTNSRRRKFEQNFDQQIGLANLEKSIKTLEKHMKLLNTNDTKHTTASAMIETKRSSPNNKQTIALDIARAECADQKRLPTIVEGLDNNNSMAVVAPLYQRSSNQDNNKNNKTTTDWHAHSTDDSLMDLNLDTFQLIDERCDKKHGITNPIFESNENEQPVNNINNDDNGGGGGAPLHKRSSNSHSIEGTIDAENESNESIYDDNNEHSSDMVAIRDANIENIENNYKCTKYINSCPDDAYNVDEIIDYKYEHVAHSFPIKSSASMPFHMKNVADHIKQQNTKDILEEIRDKLEILLKPIVADVENESSTESDDIGSSKKNNNNNNSKTVLLERNISALKRDVDSYLILINQQNEMEIQAFCSGLSKNYKLLTMQHALGNRQRRSPRISTSDIGSEVYSNRSFTDSSSGGSHSIGSHYIDYNQPLSVVRRPRRLKSHHRNDQKWKTNQLRPSAPSKIHSLTSHENAPEKCENDSIRCSSSSDSNFQLQRRQRCHSDSLCSSWNENQAIVLTSSSGHGSDSIESAPDTNSLNSSTVNDAIRPMVDEILAVATTTDNEHRLMETTLNANAINQSTIDSIEIPKQSSCIENNLAMQQLAAIDNAKLSTDNGEKDIMVEWHQNKPSIWQQYYGSKRLKYSNVMKMIKGKFDVNTTSMAYPSTRPETDFTLDLPRAEQLRVKMQQEKKSRCRCRLLLVLLGLIFFLMTVIMFSLIISSGKRMFGSMA